MIPTTIKDLFKFIDFLHANIDNFNQNNELLNDLKNLANQKSEVKKIGSFKDRLEYEKIQKEINHKFEKLKKEVNNKITAKAKKYNITQDLIVINLSYEELQKLKDKATFEDLETINENKDKYLTYRLKTNKEDYFSLGFLFSNLDSYFFNLFDYFSEDKTGLEILQSKKNSLPQARQSIKDSVYKKLQPVQFFSFKHDEKDKVLSLDNYKELIKPFSSYQLSLYDDKYTLDEKKQLERSKLARIKAEDPDFDILKNRYLKYLNEVDDNQKTKVKTVPSFDPNQFNEDGAKLFEYLVENYIDLEKKHGLQKRFTNVWHFMKNDNPKKDTYKFYFTKDEYKAYVFKRYNLAITNTDKSLIKYEEVDLIQLKDHVLAFEDLYKSETNSQTLKKHF